MAVTLIQNGFVAGAMNGLMGGRQSASFTPGDYAAIANTARAIADECIVRNAALGAPMADADNAQIGQLCEAVSAAIIGQGFSASATAADFLQVSNEIVACTKQCVAKLI